MRTRAIDDNITIDGEVAGGCGAVVNTNTQAGRQLHGDIGEDHIATTLEPNTVAWITGYAEVTHFDLRFTITLHRNDQQVVAVAVESSAHKIEDGVTGNVNGFDGAA